MEIPHRDSYSPTNFIEWRDADSLEISPKFQRRSVWKLAQRSYLIDTLLRHMPVPPLYLRNVYHPKRKKLVREVVDGQQRLRAVLDYIDNRYAISTKIEGSYAGERYDDLDEDEQTRIMSYRFICETFDGISDREVLEVFQRLNTHSVPLSAQELRNGRYFGKFKQSCYRLAFDHLEFWRKHKIFSEGNIARMLEVQLTSELLIAQILGMQDKKKSIDQCYADFDKRFPRRIAHERRFRATIDQISETFDTGLVDTQFRRPPFFYTLYCVVFHRTQGLPKMSVRTPRKKMNASEQASVKEAVNELSQAIVAAREERVVPKRLERFVNNSRQQTDNIQPRQIRFDTLYNEAFR